MGLTVTESAIIDLERQREAMAARAKNFDPVNISISQGGDSILPEDTVDALSAPVRIVVTFDDPLHTRQQIHALQAALVEALVLTQDYKGGINRQRMALRHVLKTAADTLVYMNGKTPHNKRRLKRT
jgi:hypothetical protein